MANIIEVDVNSTVMRQNEVPDRIRTLNGNPVVVPGLEKPRVLFYE